MQPLYGLGDAAPAESTMPVAHPHSPYAQALGFAVLGGLTAGGLILQTKGYKEIGMLLYVTAILGTTTVAAMRCFKDGE